MEKHYTELNIETLKQGFDEKKVNKSSNTILLLIATFTAAILAVMLLILIQKKISTNDLNSNSTENNIIVSPTIVRSPTITPVVSEPVQKLSSSPSGTIVPTRKVTIFPTDKIASPTGDVNL